MRDVFLSYASEDRARASRLVRALEASGRSVWWDRQAPIGRDYEEEIQERLDGSRSVVVLWSRRSVKSRWVKAEAQDAADRGRLFPVFLDSVKAPLEYRYLNGVDLTGWDGAAEHEEVHRLLAALPPVDNGAPRPTPIAPEEHEEPTPPATAEPGAGEVTAMRLLSKELAEILDRLARRPKAAGRRRAADGTPGEVTLARTISRRLAETVAGFADTRGRVLPSTLTLRYLAWAVAVPTLLLLLLHGALLLAGADS